jgi:GMP synthase (glutamine-hydrolysing)
MTHIMEAGPLSRRTFLHLAGLGIAGTLLTGCGSAQANQGVLEPGSPTVPTATHTPTPAPTQTPTAEATLTPTVSPTATPFPSPSRLPSRTPTLTPTPTSTRGPLRVISLIHGPARSLVVDHALQRFGVLTTDIRVDLGEAVPDLSGYDAVIFAGGEYRPEEFEAPFFQAEKKRILAAINAGVPILGICLGNQLLAYWLGGEVKTGRWEMGWLPVAVNDAGLADPLLRGMGAAFYAFLWHGDQVTRLPKEGVLLASTENCPIQAFRLKDRPVWGLQFNPQYDPVMAEAVIRGSSWLPKQGYDIDELVALGYREYDDVAGHIFGNFFGVVEGEGANAVPKASGTAAVTVAGL